MTVPAAMSVGNPGGVPPRDRARTVAHLAATTLTAIGHVSRHISAAQGANPDSVTFNLQHAATHVDEAAEHARKLIAALAKYHPDVAAELGMLQQETKLGPALPVRSGKDRYDYNATGSGRDPQPA